MQVVPVRLIATSTSPFTPHLNSTYKSQSIRFLDSAHWYVYCSRGSRSRKHSAEFCLSASASAYYICNFAGPLWHGSLDVNLGQWRHCLSFHFFHHRSLGLSGSAPGSRVFTFLLLGFRYCDGCGHRIVVIVLWIRVCDDTPITIASILFFFFWSSLCPPPWRVDSSSACI